MTKYKLLRNNHPLLKIPLVNVGECSDRNQIKEDLIETMKEHSGVGLSANQVGLMERAFVMYGDFSKREPIACFNPKIIQESEEDILMEEGCLTWPGVWLKIKRPVWIEVEYEDENGEQIKNKFTDLEARAFLHEYDHMEGSNFTEKVSKLRLNMALRRAQKKSKQAARLSKQIQ